jgi:hypothetical protein
VLIRGEAGIGKTRLGEELIDWTAANGVNAVATRCYAGEGRLAYAPIAAWLKRDALQTTLMKLDASWLTEVARLRPELIAARPDVPVPDAQLESWQRLRFFEALAQAFRAAGGIDNRGGSFPVPGQDVRFRQHRHGARAHRHVVASRALPAKERTVRHAPPRDDASPRPGVGSRPTQPCPRAPPRDRVIRALGLRTLSRTLRERWPSYAFPVGRKE